MAEASPQPSSAAVDDDLEAPEDGGGQESQDDGKSCGLDRGKPARKYTDIPTGERLTYPRGNQLDRIYASTPKPYGLVPARFMPIWPELPGDIKLPILPAPKDLFEISRGAVGTGLYRPVQDYTVLDPHNRERVVTSPYDALHDPHAKSHFNRSFMKNHLLKSKLVFPDGLVRCNTKEFNAHRRYLNKRIYTAALSSAYSKMGEIEENQKAQVKRIKKDVSRAEGAIFKTEQTTMKAKQFYATRMEARRKLFEATRDYAEFRSQAHAQMLAEHRGSLQLRGLALEARIQTKLALVKAADEKRRKFLFAQLMSKEERAAAYIKSEKERKCKEREEFLIDWLSVRCEAQKRQIACAAETKKTVAATLKRRAMNRQKKIDKDRAGLAERLAARVAELDRLWALVRKYFYRWLDNVRMRKARRPDEFHRSFWEPQGEMDVTLVHLRKESGYEKLDDFIMNIVKLKRDIMAELEAEEAAEAAAGLSNDGSDKSGSIDQKEPSVVPSATTSAQLPGATASAGAVEAEAAEGAGYLT